MKRIAFAASLLLACGDTSNGNNPGSMGSSGTTGTTGTSGDMTMGPTGPSDTPVVEPNNASAVIGTGGGKITLGDLQLTLPKNAVPSDTLITVSRSDDTVAGYKLFSKLFSFDPPRWRSARPSSW